MGRLCSTLGCSLSSQDLSAPHRELTDAPSRAAFAERLRAAISRRGWSLKETAHQSCRFLDGGAKFGPAHVWHYLQGRTLPNARYLLALSRALGLDADELIPLALQRGPRSAGERLGKRSGPAERKDVRDQKARPAGRSRAARSASPKQALPFVLVLSADDSAGKAVASRLQSYGYGVALSSVCEEALRQLQVRQVGVLVADLDGEVTDRLSLVRRARHVDPWLTVIYTAREPSRLAGREELAGAPCLRSPYRPDQLLSLIRQQLLRRCGNDQDHEAA